MSLTIDSSTIKDVVGASGSSITNAIIGGTSGTVFWQAEEYVFQNGTLASGTLNNFTITDGYLHAGIGAEDKDVTYDTTAKIENIDFTNYSKLDITLDYNTYANYGSASVAYGIDNCWTTELPNSDNSRITTTITIDVSSYTGTHYIGFGLTCENNSSESTWSASSNIWISSIRLYN